MAKNLSICLWGVAVPSVLQAAASSLQRLSSDEKRLILGWNVRRLIGRYKNNEKRASWKLVKAYSHHRSLVGYAKVHRRPADVLEQHGRYSEAEELLELDPSLHMVDSKK
uniref:Uncharacterized protein n=1 Tax=Solanum lycopersicum TaxID=4081 RepID=A0A3Q7HB33_SOLLC